MSFLPPPLPPVGASGPAEWEETEPVPPQPQLVNDLAPRDDEVIGGVPEPEDPELEDEPTGEEIAMSKAEQKMASYRARKTKVTHRAAMFMRGEITVKDLDDEELKRGRFRDSDGHFRGRSASKIPAAFHDEIIRRMLERGADAIRMDFLGAIDTITEIMYDDTNDAAVRLRAAALLVERFAGKTPEKIELGVTVKAWEQTLKGIIKTPPADLGVIDAVVVDDDEETDEDDER